MKVCKKCMSPVEDGQTYCKTCGSNLYEPDSLAELTPAGSMADAVNPTPSTYAGSPSQKNSNIGLIIGLVVIIGIVVVIAIVLMSNSADQDKIETNGYALWEAGEGTKLEYTASGTYTNIYDSGSPRNVSGGYKLWVTSASSTSITMGSEGEITISGMGSTPTNFGGTSYRSDIKNDTSSTITTISTKAGDVRCYVIVEHTSTAVYDVVTITTYRGVDDGVMYKRTYEQAAYQYGTYGSLVMSCNVTYTLKSLYIEAY